MRNRILLLCTDCTDILFLFTVTLTLKHMCIIPEFSAFVNQNFIFPLTMLSSDIFGSPNNFLTGSLSPYNCGLWL